MIQEPRSEHQARTKSTGASRWLRSAAAITAVPQGIWRRYWKNQPAAGAALRYFNRHADQLSPEIKPLVLLPDNVIEQVHAAFFGDAEMPRWPDNREELHENAAFVCDRVRRNVPELNWLSELNSTARLASRRTWKTRPWQPRKCGANRRPETCQ